MTLRPRGVIAIPGGLNSDVDHGAFGPKTRRVTAGTRALVPADRFYALSPSQGGVLELEGA